MPKKKHSIYLSSTTKDLFHYRERVKQNLRMNRFEIRDTVDEDVARPDTPLDVCLADVAQCDLFIGLIGYRYGWVPSDNNSEQLSITEHEYRHAVKLNKRRLIFIADDPDWPWSRVEQDADKKLKIDHWRNELMEMSQSTWKPFAWEGEKKPDKLAALVQGAVFEEVYGSAKTDTTVVWPADISPYPGLTSFTFAHRSVYFGRQKEVQVASNKLTDPACRFLIVSGASGSGKSSFVEAGLLPRMLDNPSTDDAASHYIRIRTGDERNPLRRLASAFGSIVNTLPGRPRTEQLMERWSASPEQFGEDLAASNCPVEIVVLDQMEELFTICDEEFREPFINALTAAAANERTALRCVLTSIRSDYRDRCQDIPVLADVLRNWHYIDLFELPRLAIVDMIRRPAQLAALDITQVEDLLVGEVESKPSSLPLLAATLAELWIAREGNCLTAKKLSDLKGVGGVITIKAEDAFAQLITETGSANAKIAFNAVFGKLVRVRLDGEPTRVTALLSQFTSDPDQNRLIALFSDEPLGVLAHPARLLVVDTDGESRATVDVAHEALFRSWDRLKDWIAARRKDEQIMARAAYDALEWHEKGRPISATAMSLERLRDIRESMKNLGRRVEDEERKLTQYAFPRDWLLARLECPLSEVGHAARAHIGDLLDQMDVSWDGRRDDRPGVGITVEGLPNGGPAYWVEVPGGSVELELEEDKRERVKVAGFSLAKYPVTTAQFKAFIDAEDGYCDLAHWPLFDTVPSPFEHYGADQLAEPITNCAWLEAAAYCRWLTQRLHASGSLSQQQQVRLPQEAEWQLAASGGDIDMHYPWGIDWGEGCANTVEAGLRREVAVGLYPAGGTERGILDLSGNSWEWCLDKTDRAMGSGYDRSDDSRVLRGGSCVNTQVGARVSFRLAGRPGNRGSDLGFRLCLSSPIEGY